MAKGGCKIESISTDVFLVEDDTDIRELAQEFLSLEGYSVEAYANGIEALAALSSGVTPAVILLDWRMPKMSGKQFLDEFRKLKFISSPPPVYLFSAESDHRVFGDLGCAGVIKKPVNLHTLLDLVEKNVKASRNLSGTTR